MVISSSGQGFSQGVKGRERSKAKLMGAFLARERVKEEHNFG